MKCIIIDDEQLSREILSLMIIKTYDFNLVSVFNSGSQAIDYINQGNHVDLIFLDIHMPNFSGIDFVKTIKNPPKVIMVTTDQNFACEAFSYNFIVDYLVKPIQEDRFKKATEKVKRRLGFNN